MIATANNVASGYMTESGAREVFADPERSLGRDRSACRQSGSRRWRHAGERPVALRQRDYALRMGLGGLHGDGEW